MEGGGSPRESPPGSYGGGLRATGRGLGLVSPASRYEPCRGRSVGVGTLSVCSRERRVRSAAWKISSGEAGIEDAT